MSHRIAPTPLPIAEPAQFEFLPDDFIPVANPIPTVLPVENIPTVEPIATVEPIPRRRKRVVEGDDPIQQFVAIGRGFARFLEWCFGMMALLVGLAVLAAIPIVQFLTLGYLLESGGRLARTGKFSEAFIGVRAAW